MMSKLRVINSSFALAPKISGPALTEAILNENVLDKVKTNGINSCFNFDQKQ